MPDAVELPKPCIDSQQDWQHAVVFEEWNDFAPRELANEAIVEFRTELGLVLVDEEDEFRVIFEWTGDVGAPERPRQFAFELQPGQTGCLSLYGRLPLESTWLYQRIVHNVGWVASCEVDLFLRVPTYRFESHPRLY